MKKQVSILLLTLACLALTACGEKNESEQTETMMQTEGVEVAAVTETAPETEEATTEALQPYTMTFVDAFGESYETTINPEIAMHPYDLSCFSREGDFIAYKGDDNYDYELGIDVSKYNGDVDWNRVKDQGISFAFVRIGYRGYGSAGKLGEDPKAMQNIAGAKAAGLEVGVYFFSQAINEDEAIEEADYVLSLLGDTELELPIVFDPESILTDDARTDNVTGEQFTKNSVAFCQRIAEAGYAPMIYCNMKWEAFELDLTQLSDYPIWYADYEALPQTPYNFTVWQYSESGTVSGVDGAVDLDVRMIPKAQYTQ